jgi:Tol biopolymer transport system component
VLAADGTGTVERLTDSANVQVPASVSPDGRQLLFNEAGDATGLDVLTLSLNGTRAVTPLIKTRFHEGSGVVSPDGRWLAYQADDTGQFEIYVRPWPDVEAGQWQVSTGGGTRPLWGRDSRELFYLRTDGGLMRLAVEGGTKWTPSAPTLLLEGSFTIGGSPGRTFDISTDGRRFLMIKEGGTGKDAAPPQIVVVQNWFEELKRLVPTN